MTQLAANSLLLFIVVTVNCSERHDHQQHHHRGKAFDKQPDQHDVLLRQDQYALFRVTLRPVAIEDQLGQDSQFGQLLLDTDIPIDFNGRAIDGNLVGQPVFVSNSFPGRISVQTVVVTSLSPTPVKLRAHYFTPQDENRFTFEVKNSTIGFGDNAIGKVYFDPTKLCGISKTCYSGLETPKEVGHLWLLGLALHPDTGYIDRELNKLSYSRWTSIATSTAERTINATLNFETDSGHRLSLETSATLEWPRLFCGSKNYVKFPMTRIGDEQVKDILIENPSSQPLLIQAVLLSNYPSSEAALNSLSSYSWWSDAEIKLAELKPRSFRLVDVDNNTADHDRIRELFNVIPAPNSVTMLLPVGQRARIAVGFQPQLDSVSSNKNTDITVKASTFLLLRNNLTIIDAIHLSGEGGLGFLKIGSQLPGLKSLLNFDVQEKHLAKSCKKNLKAGASPSGSDMSESAIEPQFTVHKSFSLTNYGKLPVRIRRFLIGPHSNTAGARKSTLAAVYDRPQGANKIVADIVGRSPCSGFGFKVLNCETLTGDTSFNDDPQGGLIVRPNESKKLHIAFTPDFSMSKSMATLTIYTDDDPIDLHALSNASIWDKMWIAAFSSSQNSNSKTKILNNGTRTIRKYRRPPITYSLIATLPKHLLPLCTKALPRPNHELAGYYLLVITMICMLMVSIVWSFFDGARMLNQGFYPAVIMCKNGAPPPPDNLELFNFSAGIEQCCREKEARLKQEMHVRKRKGANNNKNCTKNLPPMVHYRDIADTSASTTSSNGGCYASWANYFSEKFHRRDSSASAGSNGSSKVSGSGSSRGRSSSSNLTNRSANSKPKKSGPVLLKDPKIAGEDGSAKKKRGWFASWRSMTTAAPAEKLAEEPPAPLLEFDAFNEEESRVLKGKQPKKQPAQKSDLTLAAAATGGPTVTETPDAGKENNSNPPSQCSGDSSPDFSDLIETSTASSSSNAKDPLASTKTNIGKALLKKPTDSNPFDCESFGFWTNDILTGTTDSSDHKASTNFKQPSKAIWDEPITSWDQEQAMFELRQQQAKQRKTKDQNTGSKNSKHALCSFSAEENSSDNCSSRETSAKISGGRGQTRANRDRGSFTNIGTFVAPTSTPEASSKTHNSPASMASPVWTSAPSTAHKSLLSDPLFHQDPSKALRLPPGLTSRPATDLVSTLGFGSTAGSTIADIQVPNSWVTDALLDRSLSNDLNTLRENTTHWDETADLGRSQSRLKDWANIGSGDVTTTSTSDTGTHIWGKERQPPTHLTTIERPSSRSNSIGWTLDPAPGSRTHTPPNSLWPSPAPSPALSTATGRFGVTNGPAVLDRASQSQITGTVTPVSSSPATGFSLLLGKSPWSPISPSKEQAATNMPWTLGQQTQQSVAGIDVLRVSTVSGSELRGQARAPGAPISPKSADHN